MIIYVPAAFAVAGLILFFAVKNNADVKKVGETMFWCGLLVTLFQCAGQTVSFLRG